MVYEDSLGMAPQEGSQLPPDLPSSQTPNGAFRLSPVSKSGIFGGVYVSTFLVGAALCCPTSSHARPGDYGKLRGEFRQLCEFLKEDGRSDLVANLLEPHLPKDKECPDCRPLFIQLFNPCEPPPPPKVKPTPTPVPEGSEGESADAESTATPTPAPTAVPPQRFPQLAVLELASGISMQLAADERNPAQTLQAVEKLVGILTPRSLKPGEKDYLETLTVFLMSGFESEIVPPKVAKPKPSTKGLFGEEDEEPLEVNSEETAGEEEAPEQRPGDGFR